MSALQKTVLKSRLPPVPPSTSTRSRDGSFKKNRQKDYTPTMWSEYFHEQKDVKIDEQHTFRVYLSMPPQERSVPLIVLLHGGGFSALTWSLFVNEITAIIHCQCMAIDLRGHGDTQTINEDDLSAETLAADVSNVLHAMYPENAPQIMIVGHSMGGAICVHISHLRLIPTLLGCVVIDVVEGTAMEALASQGQHISKAFNTPSNGGMCSLRPQLSLSNCLSFSIRSGQIRNIESAKVSMPGQVVNCQSGLLATNELPLTVEANESSPPVKFTNPLAISEDAELEVDEPTVVPIFKAPTESVDSKKYRWRIDLAKSEKFWTGWFEGLSQKFLDLPVPKLLLLASIDGLDRTLTVGQMQGKFQMQVLARCGHAVHEDRPHEVAEVIASYMVRNKFAQPSTDFVRQMPAC
ncbi:Protein phosphatase methylesterase 1 [Pseudolycoriella hygida]|uniref:Protein phosphatase methylesterase 1 n=1 Tax=Pseudolycoriella hygida TaxID=35572 RepID=A0A9Q0MKE7_9DIPT|nr:Protein phosphatase methylesterase 1 [Pseudolycoriella hygida]